jgi:hypothetical protein
VGVKLPGIHSLDLRSSKPSKNCFSPRRQLDLRLSSQFIALFQPKPPSGSRNPYPVLFAFKEDASQAGADDAKRGFADVWKRDFFGWEYEGKKKSLAEAYKQLLLWSGHTTSRKGIRLPLHANNLL